MKKILLFLTSVCMAIPAFSQGNAENEEDESYIPSGNLFIVGMNSGIVGDEKAELFMRDQIEGDEDVWRWRNTAFEVTEESGQFSVFTEDGLELGFDEEENYNENLLVSNRIIFLQFDSPKVNFELAPAIYTASVTYFKGSGMWMISVDKNEEKNDDNFYLLGLNPEINSNPCASNRFVKSERSNSSGSSSTVYIIPKYYIPENPLPFNVYSGSTDEKFGAEEGVISEETPSKFIYNDENDPIACNLTPGFYSITYMPMATMGYIEFSQCENQTPFEELDYYLLGVNGINEINESLKFFKTINVYEYEDEETGEKFEIVDEVYKIKNVEINSFGDIFVKGSDNITYYGYNNDLESIFPNDINEDEPEITMVVFGEPAFCSLDSGNYDIEFSLMGTIGFLSIYPATGMGEEEGNVESFEFNENIEPIYYDLQGHRINNPVKGIYIIKIGNKVKKMVK